MIKFKSEEGFSLAELMVAAGLLGIVTLGINFGLGVLSKQTRNTATKKVIQEQLNTGLRYMQAHSNGISWQIFDYLDSYYQMTNMDKTDLVGWTEADIDTINTRNDLRQTLSTTMGNADFFIDSFTLMKEKGGSNGIYFSRCVTKEQYTNADFTPQQALDLPRRPYLIKNNARNYIYCAPSGTTGNLDLNYRIDGRKSEYRVMSFYYKKGTWKQMPAKHERRFIIGSGFMFFFNRKEAPDSFIAYNFVADDPCYRYDRDESCNREPIISLRKLSGPVQETGVHDSGFMIIQ